VLPAAIAGTHPGRSSDNGAASILTGSSLEFNFNSINFLLEPDSPANGQGAHAVMAHRDGTSRRTADNAM
jgi:hypothetical protein